jgi:very-short-patch-repair endonuclease
LAKKITNEEFKEKIIKLVGNEYTFLEDYVNSSTEILCKHNKCGYSWKIKPNNFISNGNRCPICNHVKSKKENYKKLLYDKLKENYEILEWNKDSRSNIKLKCKKCKNIFEKSYSHIITSDSNIFCNNCNIISTNDKNKYIKNNLEKEINSLNKDFKFIEGYYNSNKENKIKIKHLFCNNEFNIDFKNFSKNQICPFCKKLSIGEEKVKNFLLSENISFTHDFIIRNNDYLKNKPYDFYLEDYNLIIEVNGTQHYFKKWYMNDKDLEDRQNIDKNKYNIAELLGYNILIIKYDEFDKINEIISKEISKVQRLSKP